MAKKVSFYALFTALALLFSFVESLYSLNFIAPGIKLGLANCVALLFVFKGDFKGAFLVNIARILLSTLLFSAPSTLIFSLTAGVLSLTLSCLAEKTKLFSPIGVGVTGAVTHNLVQLAVAAIITATKGVLFYAAPLIFSGLICGILTGLAAGMIEKKIKKVI